MLKHGLLVVGMLLQVLLHIHLLWPVDMLVVACVAALLAVVLYVVV